MNNLKKRNQNPDEIARICLDAYNNLAKTGKPPQNEWTVLCCVVKYDDFVEEMQVVAIGTGSKCIGASSMTPNGYVLNDCHAEIMARRGFLLYLYDNFTRAASGENMLFRLEDGKFRLDENIEFYFYSSQLPCGDACILPMTAEEIEEQLNRKNDCDEKDSLLGYVVERKRPGNFENDEIKEAKRQKLESGDVHRTGAKCLPQCEQDSKIPGIDYHALGQVRIKPGRGDPTLSVSCSDKMARWVRVGIQGALINMVLHEPIFIKQFVFGSGKTYSKESLERALLYRNFDKSEVKLECVPKIEQTNLVFTHNKSETRTSSNSASIFWVKFPYKHPLSEVANQGRKQGVVKKCQNKLSSSLSISKYNLYQKFLTLALSLPEPTFKNIFGVEEKSSLIDVPYNEMKLRSESYVERWESVKTNFFGCWTIKPDIWNFCVDLTKK